MTTIYLILLTLYLIVGIRICRVKVKHPAVSRGASLRNPAKPGTPFLSLASHRALWRRRVNNRYQHELSPTLILVLSYYMYSVAMPISRLCFDSAEMEYDAEYMLVQLLGAAGIIIGLLFQRYHLGFVRNRNESSKQVSRIFRPLPALIIMSISVGIVMFGDLRGLGWDLSAIVKPYGYETTLLTGNREQTLFGQILWVLAISSTALAFIGAYNTKNNKLILFALLVGGLFGMFYMVRGSRNMAGMMIIPFIGAYLFSKPIKIKYLLLACLCIFFVVYIIGVVRNVGFGRLADVPVKIETFDPLSQELGTNYRIFTTWKEMDPNKSLLLGKSYTTDVLYSMMPRYFWPDRPPGLCVQFSLDYFHLDSVDELYLALGFSPIVEALVNFGRLGIVPVFALFSFLIAWLESWFKRHGAWGVSCYAFTILVVFNWNRMDMNMTLKILIIYLVISKIFAIIIFPRKRKDIYRRRTLAA